MVDLGAGVDDLSVGAVGLGWSVDIGLGAVPLPAEPLTVALAADVPTMVSVSSAASTTRPADDVALSSSAGPQRSCGRRRGWCLPWFG